MRILTDEHAVADVEGGSELDPVAREARAQFHLVCGAVSDGVFVLEGGLITVANRAFAQLVGRASPTELVGTPLEAWVHPDERARLSTLRSGAFVEVRVRGAVATTVELGLLPADPDDPGAEIGYVRDVSARSRAREGIARQARRAALGTYAAGIAHEINNPLAYVSVSLDLALRQLAEEGPAASVAGVVMPPLRSAYAATSEISRKVKDLLAFCRREPRNGVVEIDAVVRQCLRLLERELADRARVIYVDGGGSRQVRGATAQVGQAFLQLLVHVLRCAPVRSPDENDLRLRVYSDESWVQIEIEHDVVVDADVQDGVAAGEGGPALAVAESIVHTMGGDLRSEACGAGRRLLVVRLPAVMG